jgi:hypothetical protein
MQDGGTHMREISEQLARERARVAALFEQSSATALAAGAGVLDGLERARSVYRLTAFEREVLLLALLPEVDDDVARAYARIHGEPARTRPTVGLLVRWLAHLGDGDVIAAAAALAPDGHLVRTGLIDLIGDGPASLRQVVIPPAFWPRLLGMPATDPFRIARMARGALDTLILEPETRASAQHAVGWALRSAPAASVVSVVGVEGSGRETRALAIAAELDLAAIVVAAESIQADEVTRALAREAAWHRAAIVVRGTPTRDAIAQLASEVSTRVIVVGPEAVQRELAPLGSYSVEVRPLRAAERARLWQQMLGDDARAGDVEPEAFAARFRFGPGRVSAIVQQARTARDARGQREVRGADLLSACSAGVSTAQSLATRLDCPYEPEDLVLPPQTRRELSLIVAWARHAHVAFREGGPGARIKAREGLVALFAGNPGTGKTMAAQVIARQIGVALVRVDLSQVVNKYIGETEKNLDRVFTEAEASGTLLFFDEADALFSKRSEVHDAHDRYSNLETAFLLQRLETHPGIVILASNIQSNLDAAFMRRIQVVAEFPPPGKEERHEIWQRHLAREHLAADVELAALAQRFSLAGGDIRNAAITAVLLAAAEGSSITMRQLVIGVWRELQKAGRLVSPDAFGPWSRDVVAYARS